VFLPCVAQNCAKRIKTFSSGKAQYSTLLIIVKAGRTPATLAQTEVIAWRYGMSARGGFALKIN
jgi:hypothetical protein